VPKTSRITGVRVSASANFVQRPFLIPFWSACADPPSAALASADSDAGRAPYQIVKAKKLCVGVPFIGMITRTVIGRSMRAA